ncbi:sensor histidine kinase [Salinimonas lutimaris]|uniref:sensor histidine kinase n=1 Tax=Salinimonas lutimaris TaxID=914153 RepID=UPI0010BF85B8|nr:ATP-binding protein [Salinimonas lutimaris]
MAYDSALYSTYSDNEFLLHDSPVYCSDPVADPAQEVATLRKQANRLSDLLQVMPNGVIVLDGSGIVRQANRQAMELLGEPLEGEIWRSIITRSFKPRADDGHEVSLIDGRRVKLSITPLQNEPGQLIVITDLTETRQLQARVSHMQRLSSLGKMVASLAHQIRTPLSAAMLYAANLSRPDLDKSATQRFASKMSDRLQELEGQVNDMLLFAKSGEDQVVGAITATDIKLAVAPTALSIGDQHQQTIVFEGFEQSVSLTGNITALQGALLNLIHNACQVNPAGGQIILRASIHHQNLQITVSDQGPGIEQAQVKRIFEPFYTTKTHGTGLGLAVVKSVANSHKGSLSVHNLPGGGASFVMCLPVLNAHSAAQSIAGETL